jgi:hypothetical protein
MSHFWGFSFGTEVFWEILIKQSCSMKCVADAINQTSHASVVFSFKVFVFVLFNFYFLFMTNTDKTKHGGSFAVLCWYKK